ncbi:MAG: oligopeptide transporter ATP-binding component [Sphaerisporangium sp.]|nr:oligopeptide transporter ATP-binding component [Sphaerisporangium sp.]
MSERSEPTSGQGGFLELKDLRIHFPTDDGLVRSVDGLSFTLERGRTLGIVGESGSGKSVTSLGILGLHKGTRAKISGEIWLDGEELVSATPEHVRTLRGKKMAMIFQDPLSAMHPYYTVGAQIIEAYRIHHRVSKAVARKHAIDMLGRVGIPQPERRVDSYPHEFSGGMRQRAMIAMAVINNPDIIIADEPTTALDVTVQAQILEKLLEVKDAVNAAIVLITHDLGVIAGMAHRVLVMYAGRPVEIGDTDPVFEEPRMPYTAGLLGSIPSLENSGTRLRPIKGTPPSLINLPTGCPFSPRCPLADDKCRTAEPELTETDSGGHFAACHHWDRLAAVEDPTVFFRTESETMA